MIRYLNDVTGLWNMRYDEPRLPLFPRRRSAAPASRRHLVPRWCISANLRSLALPLSFLPASPLVFPSPFPSPISSRLVFLVSKDGPPRPPFPDPRRRDTWNGKEVRRTVAQCIPGPLGRPYRRDLIGSIRYSVAVTYTYIYIYMYIYAPVFLCPCRSFDTRYLIRDREARSRSKTD